uniref:hypothetical protein n=1 Tax=Listeria seeligeri TaxID=1640 RepID=UPI001D1120EA|nr:hypothetical protein [Listeria seeligeri]UCK61850.1 hypothetical protein pLIS51_00226c [Listeria seeligeri]
MADWYEYGFQIALSTNVEEPSCIKIFSKKRFSEKEIKEIVIEIFEKNKEELLFSDDNDNFLIDSSKLCKLMSENYHHLENDPSVQYVEFSKLEVSE